MVIHYQKLVWLGVHDTQICYGAYQLSAEQTSKIPNAPLAIWSRHQLQPTVNDLYIEHDLHGLSAMDVVVPAMGELGPLEDSYWLCYTQRNYEKALLFLHLGLATRSNCVLRTSYGSYPDDWYATPVTRVVEQLGSQPGSHKIEPSNNDNS